MPEAGEIRATLTDLPGDYGLSLYDNNFSWLTGSGNGGTEDELIVRTLDPGVYYLAVDSDNYDFTSPYTIRVTYPGQQPIAMIAAPPKRFHRQWLDCRAWRRVGYEFRKRDS